MKLSNHLEKGRAGMIPPTALDVESARSLEARLEMLEQAILLHWIERTHGTRSDPVRADRALHQLLPGIL